MIAAEKDSVFKLQDAFISFTEKDSAFAYEIVDGAYKFKTTDTIVINKKIELENVHFEHLRDDIGQALPHIIFNKDVTILETTSILFFNYVFKGDLELDTSVLGNDQINEFGNKHSEYEPNVGFFNTTFYKNVLLDIGSIENYSSIEFSMFYGIFISNKERNINEIATNSIRETNIDENIFKGKGYVRIAIDNSLFTSVYKNNFGDFRVEFSKESFNDNQVYIVEKNIFNSEFLFHINQLSINHVYRWTQWKRKILSTEGFDLYLKHLMDQNNTLDYDELYETDSVYNNYKNKYKYELDNSYKFEMQLLGQFYDFYKLQHDSDYANEVYVEFKDLETKRYAYLYK